MRLQAALEQYLNSHLGLSSKYEEVMATAVRHFVRDIETDNVTTADVAAWMRAELAAGKSPATVNTKRRSLLTILRSVGVRLDVPTVREYQRLPEAWTLDECERIFQACREVTGEVAGIPAARWWLSLMVTIYWTGERIGALLSARSADCDLDTGRLVIRGENHKSRRDRVLSIPDQACNLIRLIYDPRRVLLWPWPLIRQRIYKHARRIVESAGVRCPRGGHNLFHRMRRSSGSLVEAHGGDGAKHLGNSRRVFEKHYRDEWIVGCAEVAQLPVPALPDLDRQMRLF